MVDWRIDCRWREFSPIAKINWRLYLIISWWGYLTSREISMPSRPMKKYPGSRLKTLISCSEISSICHMKDIWVMNWARKTTDSENKLYTLIRYLGWKNRYLNPPRNRQRSIGWQQENRKSKMEGKISIHWKHPVRNQGLRKMEAMMPLFP